MPMMCGGTGEITEADAKIQALCEGVKPHIELQTGKSYDVFVAKKYTKQVVAGTNYFVKVHVGGTDHIHICIYEKLPCHGGEISFLRMQEAKTEHEPIGYF